MFIEAIPLCLVLNKLAHLLSRAQNRFSLDSNYASKCVSDWWNNVDY